MAMVLVHLFKNQHDGLPPAIRIIRQQGLLERAARPHLPGDHVHPASTCSASASASLRFHAADARVQPSSSTSANFGFAEDASRPPPWGAGPPPRAAGSLPASSPPLAWPLPAALKAGVSPASWKRLRQNAIAPRFCLIAVSSMTRGGLRKLSRGGGRLVVSYVC